MTNGTQQMRPIHVPFTSHSRPIHVPLRPIRGSRMGHGHRRHAARRGGALNASRPRPIASHSRPIRVPLRPIHVPLGDAMAVRLRQSRLRLLNQVRLARCLHVVQPRDDEAVRGGLHEFRVALRLLADARRRATRRTGQRRRPQGPQPSQPSRTRRCGDFLQRMQNQAAYSKPSAPYIGADGQRRDTQVRLPPPGDGRGPAAHRRAGACRRTRPRRGEGGPCRARRPPRRHPRTALRRHDLAGAVQDRQVEGRHPAVSARPTGNFSPQWTGTCPSACGTTASCCANGSSQMAPPNGRAACLGCCRWFSTTAPNAGRPRGTVPTWRRCRRRRCG